MARAAAKTNRLSLDPTYIYIEFRSALADFSMDEHVHVCTSLAIGHLLRHMRDVTTPPQQVSCAAVSVLPYVRKR
jgi:hypothetical protein